MQRYVHQVTEYLVLEYNVYCQNAVSIEEWKTVFSINRFFPSFTPSISTITSPVYLRYPDNFDNELFFGSCLFIIIDGTDVT